MSSYYAVSNTQAGTPQAITSSFKTITQVTAATATLCRGRLYDVAFGTLGTPADQTYTFDISRQTTLGTGTTATASPLDLSYTASGSIGTVNMTAEPTTGVSVFSLGINQRASYRWVAAPGGELVWPATNLAGLGVRATSASGGTAIATALVHYSE